MSESDADKKRNKLGYQRISVACAHCRRRKIRCVMAEDSTGRCQNCIRLNKECIFHPVEQPGAAATEGSSTHSSAISHSPGELAAGQPFETRSSTYSRLAPLPSTSHDYGLAYDSSAQGTPQSAVFDYRTQQYPDTRWPMHTEPDASHNLYFSNSADDFSAHRGLTTDARSYSFSGGIHNEQQWQMLQSQGRSMSYGNFEGQTSYTQPHPLSSNSVQPMQQHYLDTHGTTMREGSGPHSAPISNFQQHGSQYSFQDVQMPQQGAWQGQDQQSYSPYGNEQKRSRPEQ